MADIAVVQLIAGRLRLELSPSIGAAICSFKWIGEDGVWPILRKCNSPVENVLESASFPLVPFVNRIRDGRFRFRGRDVRLLPNMAGDPSPLHGQGWLNPWTVEQASEGRAILTFDHAAGEWPWDYAARQEFQLDERGLSIRLSCRNTSPDPMPCGLGQHPYFPCGPQTRLDTIVSHAWTIDALVLPLEMVPATGQFDLRHRAVCAQDLDHGFGGWDGSARMTDPNWPFEILLSSPDAHFFQVYSPSSGGIFVAEPVSHANAALNEPEERWAGLGIRVLEPGEEMTLAMRLDVRTG